MNKKLIATLSLSALALIACGGKSGGGDNARIVVWGPDKEEPVVKQVVDAYNAANPDDKIEYTFVPITEADAGTTVANDPTVKGYPSLFALADDQLANLTTIKGIVNPLGTAAAEEVRANDVDTAVTAASIDGKLYAYPISVGNGYFLYYDKRIYTDDDVKTLEKVLEKAAENERTFVMDVANGYYSASFFMSPDVCGTDSLSYKFFPSADGTKQIAKYTCDWNSDVGAQMALDSSKLMVQYGADKSDASSTWLAADDNVLMGQGAKLGACVSGMWMADHLTSTWGAGNVGAVKLPTLAGKQLSSFAGTKLYCVNSYATADEQRTAHKLAQLLTNKDSQLIRYNLRNSIPCNKEAQADESYTSTLASNPTVAALQNQSQYAAIQSVAAEAAYWTAGEGIGDVLTKGTYTENEVVTKLDTVAKWKDYLTSAISTLTNPAGL